MSDLETHEEWRVTHDSPVPGAAPITRTGTENQVRAIERRMTERGLNPLVEVRTITVGTWGKPGQRAEVVDDGEG